MKEIQGLVISSTPFNDFDKMVNVLTNSGQYAFLAKGVMKLTSKNHPSVEEFTFSNFLLTSSKKGLLLRQGHVIDAFFNLRLNSSNLKYLNFLKEVNTKLTLSIDKTLEFTYLYHALKLLNDNFSGMTICLIYLAKILILNGLGLEVDHCVRSGTQSDLVALSLEDGGLVSRAYFKSEKDLALGERKLKIIRYIFKVDVDRFSNIAFNDEECLAIMRLLNDFIAANLDLKLASIKYL